MGGVIGAGLVYSQYIRAIDIFEGARDVRTQATASFFSSYAVSIQTTSLYSLVGLKLHQARLYECRHMFFLRVPGSGGFSVHDRSGHGQE